MEDQYDAILHLVWYIVLHLAHFVSFIIIHRLQLPTETLSRYVPKHADMCRQLAQIDMPSRW